MPTATSVPPTQAPAAVAYVSQMSGKVSTGKGGRKVTVSVTVSATDGRAVSGAIVSVAITAPDGSLWSASCVTGSRGQASCVAEVPNVKGTAVAQVVRVDAGGTAYDPSRNALSSVRIQVK